jgi:diguanylate cyclase (GGDEF)-like protein
MPQEPPRILIADHQGHGLEAWISHLGAQGYALDVAHSLRESVRRLGAELPEVILLQPLARAGVAELEALDRVRGTVPLLLVTSRDDAEAALRAGRALESGAWDVVFREARVEELELRLSRLLQQARLLHEMGELRHSASHDDRTDLLRPKSFQARLAEHFSAAQRHKLELALVLLDLDKFGSINKLHDHTVGDLLITRVGEVIRRNLRTEDVAGRLGGDEFAVLLPYTGKINAARVVNRLRTEIAKLSGRIEGARSEIPVSASLGFETYDGSDLDSLETLRRHAEQALRAAKLRGGDQGVYFRSPLLDSGQAG